MKFIDSHCHLDFSEFDANREALINACVAKGVSQFIVPGISLAQSQNLLGFKATYPQVSIAAGLHPYFLKQHQQSHYIEFRNSNNLEHITNIFFNQRRKMIKKPLNIILKNAKKVADELKLDVKLRPQNLDKNIFYKICLIYEKLIK